ncbi:carbohydrate ABC transporter permease [Lachnoclostridium phytofermentans]|uniref:Binding-protein-dependent transport systems inner membrane component n=1 Tax=Lachnoclostridium phytofermentans (strain ATCC 700394 / DSM 18823 / ISDg) TaxID=357809 RepID=A9KM51_LACP7|nr:sugar ABC transporter permease [Lachnoclostridium phytofermentans]ABX41394.1 binding-protein-dependent transport systems inner membrane component [Lachnoclostridium phytofermentans ISDg]
MREKNKIKRKYKLRDYEAFLWILPGIVLLLIFSYYPPISAFFYSLTDWNANRANFIGLQNFKELLTDQIFWNALKTSIFLTVVGILVGNIATIFLAELLFNLKRKKASSTYRFLFVLPCLVPGIVTMLLWNKIIFAVNETGLANAILMKIGLIDNPLTWYAGDKTVLLSLILTNFPWVAGTSFLIYLAGLQGIPESIIEAAELDGITILKRIRYIDFAYIRGQIKYFLILGFIGGLQNYSMQLLFTKGGPFYKSMVPGYYIYWQAFNNTRFGYACACGVVMFVIIFSVTIFTNKMKSSEEVM